MIKDFVTGGSLTSPVSQVEAWFYPLLFTTIILPLPKRYEFAFLLRIHLSSQGHTGGRSKTKGKPLVNIRGLNKLNNYEI